VAARRRWGNAGIWLLLLLGSLLQQPGRTTFDTKFDLTADPAAFLGRALHLWTPDTLGALQNQAYGYLFPQGPFFLGAELLQVPDWVAQRVWSWLLLLAAYEGVRRVALVLGLPWGAAVLAGLCYAFSPRLLGAVGVLSGEVLPTAVLPWAVLPLVLSLTGRLPARRAGLLSGVAILFMSGVNATGTLAALPLAFLVASARLRRRGGAALLGWWLLGAALACAWWMGPLLLQGRYSPPFLDFIETAAATTSPTGWANSLRGAEHWVAYSAVGGQAWWPGAHTLVTSPLLAFLGLGVAAAGLVGLVHPRMPLRRPLALSLALGLVCLTVGNPSVVGSFVDEPVRTLLDGPLAALRNVHKVDPLVRLPLALGLAHAAALAVGRIRLALEGRGQGDRLPVARRLVGASVAVVLLVGAQPLFLDDLRMPGWTEVPDAWTQAAAYLDDRPDSRALVVPGAGFGVQTWGWTVDEPIQGLTDTAWVTRSQVPMVPGPTARVLDAVERRLTTGQGGPALAEFLARAGITHVVLRRDIDQTVAETTSTDRATKALLDSPGLRRVAGFGRSGFGDQPLVDVFALTTPAPRASLVAERDVVTLDGGPEDVLAALDAGVLAPDRPALVQSSDEPGDVVSDGYRKVERQFGRIHDAVSEVMTGSASFREGRTSADFPGPATVGRAEATYLGVDDLSASSSQAYPDVFGAILPSYGPAAAFDGRAETTWRSASLALPVGQWLQVDLARPLAEGVLEVSFVDDGGTATVRRASVSFDGDTRVYAVPAGGKLLVTPPVPAVHDVRITVVAVAPGAGETSPVAISEVALPETSPGRTLDVPRPIGADSTVVLSDQLPRRACVDIGYGPHCTASEIRASEWNGLDRQLTVAEAGAWELSGTVVARPTAAAAALLGPLDDAAVVTAGSVFGGDPSVSGAFAFDGITATPWLADPADDTASLTLRWSGERTVSRLTVDPAAVPAGEPVRARVEASGGVRDVDLTGFGYFEPLTATDGLTVTFSRSPGAAGLPLGVGEIHLDGLDGLEHQPAPESGTGAVCGLGPEVRIDGTAHRTEVTGSVGDVLAGRPMTWRVCDGPVSLGPGVHRLVAESTAQFEPVSLAWRPEGASGSHDPAAAADDDGDRLRVVSWEDTRRVVSVSAGGAAVLRVAENVNDGWRATLDGKRLEPVVLDGWQQGYRIPAGSGGDVVLEFAPDTAYRAGLLAGLVLAVALVVLALVAPRRLRQETPATGDLSSPELVVRAGTAAAVVLGALVLGGIPFAVGWALALATPVRRYAAVLGVVALLAAGILTATSAGLIGGRPGAWADAAAALGIALLLARLVRLRRRAG
jgi:arabinofuranan 3-O-arabinosyltransferase